MAGIYLSVLPLAEAASNAMEAIHESAGDNQAQAPLAASPVPSKHMRTNYTMVATLSVVMVIAVGAICCCCYRWEGRLRGQLIRRGPRNPDELATQSSSITLPESVPSVSVIMPGDDVPRFVARGGAPTAPAARVSPEKTTAVASHLCRGSG